jgi:hypothetical protein
MPCSSFKALCQDKSVSGMRSQKAAFPLKGTKVFYS